MSATSEKTERDPRHFARAKSEWRLWAGLGRVFEAAAEWEERHEELEHKSTAAAAQLAETLRRAEAVDVEAAARRAKRDAETDQALAGVREELATARRELEAVRAELAGERDDLAAMRHEHHRLAALNAGMSASLTTAGRS